MLDFIHLDVLINKRVRRVMSESRIVLLVLRWKPEILSHRILQSRHLILRAVHLHVSNHLVLRMLRENRRLVVFMVGTESFWS